MFEVVSCVPKFIMKKVLQSYNLVLWIRIRIRIHFCRLDPDPGGQKLPTKIGGLGISKLQIKDILFCFSAVNFFPFLVIKTLDPNPIHIDQKCCIRIRIETNADPQHWNNSSTRDHDILCRLDIVGIPNVSPTKYPVLYICLWRQKLYLCQAFCV